MKKLDVIQMENVNAGDGIDWVLCAYGLGSMVVAIGCAATAPLGGWAVAGFAFGWLGGGATAAYSCAQALLGE